MLSELPSRAKLLKLIDEENDTISMMLSAEPKRVMPKTESELPSRKKDRIERQDPNSTKSSTDSEDPRRWSP
jgi:hypothetical protein